jgi:hypothetical protein
MNPRAAVAGAVIIALPLTNCDGTIGDREPFPGAWTPTGGPGERLVYLWYADGNEPPSTLEFCIGARPERFSCSFGPSYEACQSAIQGYLGTWYSAFKVHFTVVPPPSGVAHDTLIVTRTGSWCGLREAGLAPVTCEPLVAGTAWALSCGESAEQCAAIIAQEHAHLLGLEHTTRPRDIMFTPVCERCAGFDNSDSTVVNGRCRRTQNSFALVAQALGLRSQQ